MAVLLTKLAWFKDAGREDEQVIEDWTRVNVRISTELKNNNMDIEIINNFGKSSDRQFVGDDGKLVFKVDDKFKFYCKYDINNSGLDLGDSSSDLIFFGDLREISSKVEDKSIIKLTCTDRTFSLLNGIWPYNYLSDAKDAKNGQGYTAPLIIQHVIRNKSNITNPADSPNQLIYDEKGNLFVYDKATALYLIDARLKSEGGFIQDNRSVTIDKNGVETNRTIGTPDSNNSLFPTTPISTRNYNFPLKEYNSPKKPVYEILLNLSQIDMTNTSDEQLSESSFDLIIKRSMRFYIDEKNRFHWFYPVDSIDTDKYGSGLTINMGTITTYEVKSHDLKFAISDVINFVYYEAGKDMNGDTIIDFEYDFTSGAPVFKDSTRKWPTISQNMKIADLNKGNITYNENVKGKHNYPTVYPVIPAWNSTISVNSDAEYNTEFRKKAKETAKGRAKSLISLRSSQKWKGNIVFRFYNFTIGDLLQYTSTAGGIFQEKLRINEISHIITKGDATTTLDVENDSKELEA